MRADERASGGSRHRCVDGGDPSSVAGRPRATPFSADAGEDPDGQGISLMPSDGSGPGVRMLARGGQAPSSLGSRASSPIGQRIVFNASRGRGPGPRARARSKPPGSRGALFVVPDTAQTSISSPRQRPHPHQTRRLIGRRSSSRVCRRTSATSGDMLVRPMPRRRVHDPDAGPQSDRLLDTDDEALVRKVVRFHLVAGRRGDPLPSAPSVRTNRFALGLRR